MIRFVMAAALALVAAPASAQAADAALDIGGDVFRAGQTVTLRQDGIDDLFAGAATLRVLSDIAGSAHLAGRRVVADGAVGGDLYAAGMRVEVAGPVAGDVTVMGYEIEVGDVAGDLRASGAEVQVTGEVAGYAVLAGDTVRIAGQIAGDVHVAAGDLDLAREAAIAGTLVLYETEPGRMDLRDGVAGRVERRDVSEWDDRMAEAVPTRRGLFTGYLTGVILVTALAALLAAVMPETLARLRFTVLGQPLRTAWMGALALSVLLGGAILSGLTVIGLLAVPALILAAGLLGFGGYVVGVYALGVAILTRLGRSVPDDFADRAMAAAAGAVAAGAIALLPMLGWLVVLALALAGAGAIAIALVRPRFFAEG